MSKSIRIRPEDIIQLRKDFEKAITDIKLADGKFSFTKLFETSDRKATIHYTKEAWEKQLRILKEFDKEVAWHGVAYRGEDESLDDYYITDIMVYPQTVTATTVEMDTEEYAKWLMENYDDERFDNIHMQAHSHVNMATSPSTVDLAHQEEILNMLDDENFYIFMIWNKSLNKTLKIYDIKKNVLFESTDINIRVDGYEEIDDFIKQAKEMVKNKTYTTYPQSYGGYGSPYRQEPVSLYDQNKPVVGTTPYNPVAGVKTQENQQGATIVQVRTVGGEKKDEPKKTEKKEEPKSGKERTRIGAGWSGKNAAQSSIFDEEEAMRETWGDDYNDPYFYRDH